MHRLFQFSPPRGGRPFRFISATPKSIFQFSPPRGGRLHGVVIVFGHLLISILAPARGATDITTSKVVRFQFQFPPPHGGRRERPMDWKQTILFQFPPPHGGRPITSPGAWRCGYFNSRPRTGGDNSLVDAEHDLHTFQFPPPHGGRRQVLIFVIRQTVISIPAPARGATKKNNGKQGRALFQFPPPHGGRPRTPHLILMC